MTRVCNRAGPDGGLVRTGTGDDYDRTSVAAMNNHTSAEEAAAAAAAAATAAAAGGGSSYLMQHLNDTGAGEDESLDSYLLRTRGPKHLSLSIVVPITVVYVFIFVTGVIGNIAVCVVIVRNNFMHTATNYYLFSLAVSDLTLLLLGQFRIVIIIIIRPHVCTACFRKVQARPDGW